MPQIYLEIDASGAVKGIKQYSRAASDGADATDKLAGTAEKAGGGLAGIVGKAAGAAAAVVSIATAVDQVSKSLQTFAQFDDQLRVAASYAGATAEEFQAMGRAAAEAGATTSKTASQAAQGLAEFASRGFSVREQIEALVPAIRLAEAAQVDLGRATEVSSGILRGYGKDVSELERINDIIVGISGASAANLNFVGDAAKYAIPAARAAGEEFETIAAILGTLADQQFEASQSGNAVKNMMISLIGPTKQAQGVLNQLGITTKNSQGEFVGLVPVFEQLEKANLSLTDASIIFGREFGTAGLAVTKTIGEVKKDLRLLKTGIDGITESTAEFQQAGLGGSFRRLESAVEAVYIAVGDQLAPIISDVAGVLAEFAGNASKAAGATSGIITGVQVLTQLMLGAYNAVDIVVDGLTGLFSFAVNTSPLYRGLELVAEGLEKIGAIDVNPFESARKSITEFAEAQDGSFERVQARVENLNASFDRYQRNLDKNLKSVQAAEAAERALTQAAEDAATAAGKQAIAAGKSTEEALSAAEAAKKAYLTSAQAAKEQEAADKKASEAAEKRRAALEKQAETVRKQALSYGATESAAQAAADKVLEAGKAADNITGAGPDKLNKSLDQTVQKAGAAQVALAGIGDVGLPAGGGGEISYSVGLNTQQYDQKVSELKESVEDLNKNFILKLNADPEGATALATELDKLEKELSDTQAIQGYNEQLRSLQAQYREVRQEFLGGKLEIVTDQEAAANIRSQIAAVTDLKLSVDGIIPGLERVDGVWQQLPDTLATAVQPAIASLGTFSDAAGEIETTWKQIDGVWAEVLPNGEVLVSNMTETLYAGEIAANAFGQAVAGAAQAAAAGVSPVEKALKEVEDQIVKTQNAAGGLKLDQLAAQTGAFNAVSGEISDLQKKIKELDPTSKEAAVSIKQLLQLEAVKSELGDNISSLKKEIYDTGEEAKSTGDRAVEAARQIAEIPAQANSAAQAVEELAKANEKLAEAADLAAAAGKKASGSFIFTVDSSIEGINSRIKELNETISALEKIQSYDVDTSRLTDSVQELEAKKWEIRMENVISNFIGSIKGFGESTQMSSEQNITINNNFQGLDRSDAVDILNESARQFARA